ncbi:AMP-binding protein [Candidatus Avoscillospira sp. LCP25S3_F1]|uniref:AMP-binding protein n=1 Tax=Candidatus Avoscillospira sp. LCP25S3_F1 TaxID=3438825 RepID=UPI003F92591C
MERFFLDAIGEYGERCALISESARISYQELDALAKAIVRQIPARSLVFCICTNQVAAVAGYVGFLQKRIVPIMLSSSIDAKLFEHLYAVYRPAFLWCPSEFANQHGQEVWSYEGYRLYQTGEPAPAMNVELALLLTTSGSTGSPKFVRQTYRNIEANTRSIVEYLSIDGSERAITTLPFNYTFGLSIVQTHLYAGASVILTDHTIFDKAFWTMVKEQKATSFGGVPYTFQMLDRLRFLRMELPELRYVIQAGGALGRELHEKFATGLQDKGKRLVVMYGATEATARMSYVPAERTIEKAGSIGIAIPGGRFAIIDVNGQEVSEPDTVGELVYYGDNVTMGYAENRDDLAKGDERHGRLETGDMAKRDADGYYYVVGRKKRFLKLYGNRVNLVEVEQLMAQAGYEAACVGEDDHMRIYTTSPDTDGAVRFVSEKLGIHAAAFSAIHIAEIPHNESGKVLYSELK